MKIVAYLMFAGNCEEVMNFYKDVLGGKVTSLHRYGDSPTPAEEGLKSKVMHMGIKFGDNDLYGSDWMDGTIEDGNRYSLSLNIDNPEEADKIFNGLAEGANVTMPIQETFWAQRFGMLKDKYGISWMINCEKKH